MAAKKEDERIRSTCYICNGLKFPFGAYLQFLTDEMVQHIADNHLPLKCGKCSIVFETVEDFKNVEKCCPPKVTEDKKEPIEIVKTELMNSQHKKQEISLLMPLNPQEFHEDIEALTPLSKINMRWRRKSFSKLDALVMTEEEKRQQTSTPMVGDFLSVKHFTDSSSIHLSSINYTSSTSSESGEFSPLIPVPTKEVVLPKTPPSLSKFKSLNRSRSKMPAQATPLQQVMTKSIQRAYQQHGDYRQTPFNMQKRRVSFNSTSSNETSLLKFLGGVESPLDLRLSPALRRFKNVAPTKDEEKSLQLEHDASRKLVNLHSQVEFEQIQVIISHSKINSSSIISSYKTCCSDSRRSESDIDFTPKIIGNNLLKKAISFEPPNTIDMTPAFLIPNGFTDSNQYLQEDEEDSDNDDDVFYTPNSTPVKPRRSIEVVIPIENDLNQEEDGSRSQNLWKFVSNVIKIAARKGEDISEILGKSDKIWNFKNSELVKKATDFFTKGPNDPEVQEQPQKRRRTSSDNKISSQASPVLKRPRIQPRKPIERMRKLS